MRRWAIPVLLVLTLAFDRLTGTGCALALFSAACLIG